MPTTHLLTFDIEEWFHLVGVASMADRSKWDRLEKTVEPLTEQILSILAEYNTKATFFTLGWVAERYPQLVRKIAEAGHELASHSYWHREVYDQSPETFREDLARSIGVIEDASGQKVEGFRAPSFSLTPGCEWAWDIMLDLGLTYDASVFPIARAHGGYPIAEKRCQEPFIEMPTPSGRAIMELPMSVMRLPIVGKRIAFSGGGYFRVLPWWLVKRGFVQHDSAGRPAVLYLHPWDFAPGGPSLPMNQWQRVKCYRNREGTEARLRLLLETYAFCSCLQAKALS